jgi:hypothetical protein
MRTFISVIGASAGGVILVFLVVAGVLYWSTDQTLALANTQRPDAIDSLMATQPPMPEPPALTPPKPRPRPTPVHTQTVHPKDAGPKPAVIHRPPKQTTKSGQKKTTKPAMSTEEFLAREVHYIGKIQKDADEVLGRSAETSAKMAALYAELDDLNLR